MFARVLPQMIRLITIVEATVPPLPRRIFSMPAAEANGFPDQILNDPRILGLDLGGSRAELEPTEGVYYWSFVDSELVNAEAHGNKVLLRNVWEGLTFQYEANSFTRLRKWKQTARELRGLAAFAV